MANRRTDNERNVEINEFPKHHKAVQINEQFWPSAATTTKVANRMADRRRMPSNGLNITLENLERMLYEHTKIQVAMARTHTHCQCNVDDEISIKLKFILRNIDAIAFEYYGFMPINNRVHFVYACFVQVPATRLNQIPTAEIYVIQKFLYSLRVVNSFIVFLTVSLCAR